MGMQQVLTTASHALHDAAVGIQNFVMRDLDEFPQKWGVVLLKPEPKFSVPALSLALRSLAERPPLGAR